MAEAYIGQIIAVGFKIVPVGWLPCDGKLYPIAEYQALYTLLTTTYGGDGINTFGVPDLRGRLAVHQGQGVGLSDYAIGEADGTETVTLRPPEVGQHTHQLMGSSADPNTNDPSNALLAKNVQANFAIYGDGPPDVTLAENSIDRAGSGQPHENRQPFQVISYIICANGIYPSQ